MTPSPPSRALLGPESPLPLDAPFTAPGAATLGVSPRALRTLTRHGLVRRVGHGVYAAAQAEDSVQFRAAALALVVPRSAVITDRTAAWLHGVDLLPRSQSLMPPIQLFGEPGNRTRRPGTASGERRLLRRDVTEVGGLTVTTPLRTACDLGRLLWRYDALAALDAFLAIGVGHDELLLEVARFKGYRGVIQLRWLAPLADARSESVAESALRLHWYDAGLPAPEIQWWVHDDLGQPVFRLDLALPEAHYAAEYDGDAFHQGAERQQYDTDRRNWLAVRRDWHVEVFTRTDVYAAHADPIPRLQRGLVTARRGLSTPIRYPTLPRPAS